MAGSQVSSWTEWQGSPHDGHIRSARRRRGRQCRRNLCFCRSLPHNFIQRIARREQVTATAERSRHQQSTCPIIGVLRMNASAFYVNLAATHLVSGQPTIMDEIPVAIYLFGKIRTVSIRRQRCTATPWTDAGVGNWPLIEAPGTTAATPVSIR